MKSTPLLTLLRPLVGLLLLLALWGCGGTPTPTPMSDRLTLALTMPDPVSHTELKGSAHFYWNTSHTLLLHIEQEGRSAQLITLRPMAVPSDGRTATFEVTLPSAGLDLAQPLTLSGAVVPDATDPTYRVGKGVMVDGGRYGAKSPYDLLGQVPMPLRLEPIVLQPTASAATLRAQLRPTGQLLHFSVHNGGEAPLHPEQLLLSAADDATEQSLPQDGTHYDVRTGRFTHTATRDDAQVAVSYTFPSDMAAVQQDDTTPVLLWLPTSGLRQVRVGLQYRIGSSTESIVGSDTHVIVVEGEVMPAVVSVTSKGDLVVGDKPLVEGASTLGGGDPMFTMNDITYWVGEGSQRAALVIEWHDDKSPDALVWGYRWDGKKNGRDMLRDIIAADPRLSAVFGTGMGPFEFLGGIGYQFTATTPRAAILLAGKPLPNDGKGITQVTQGQDDYDAMTFADPEAHWQSGIRVKGYWSYHTKENRLSAWSYSQVMPVYRDLVDGCWDAWSYQVGWESWTGQEPGQKFVPAPLLAQ